MKLIFISMFLLASLAGAEKQPLIYDSDYGPFVDDVFALGLLVNSLDLIDLRLVLSTSEQPSLSAKCMAAQLELSERPDIEVAVGSSFPPHEERGSVCAIQGLMGFAMEPECEKYDGKPPIENGIEYMAQMIIDSGRDDWWYLVVGGQSSLRALIEQYPEAAEKISTLVIMAGNFCADFEPYPGVMAPTDETNIGCDPAAANFVLDANNVQFDNVYYVPVVVADHIGGEDYKIFTEATESNAAANATLQWYKIWSEAGRADESLLIHAEAMKYDPDTESTPQFDPVAIMLVLELLADTCDERISLIEFDGIHFFEAGEDGLKPFPEAPRSAFSLHTGVDQSALPAECPNITEFVFDPESTPELEYPVKVALGFKSAEAKAAVYEDMARLMAGQRTLCGIDLSDTEIDVEGNVLESSNDSGATTAGFGMVASAVVYILAMLI
ncbi:inosine-uridine preferring nucleoside hydrolase [Seminavis robusta]|uniref:Inosine-uridine preferring nucleoside hydrolase n=1 Tax=Seminavis robusta TaxID=568900 RepID=A0A9N8EJB3_9STRA|nr:inosine-uridine preferring nucleoside hydrolase [Seminavis robusta]|eukprot:Sro1049_g235400.1 inosine-uridine preferring nucleoside hydrolase (441) ;mRNA; r:18531-20042